VCSARVLSSCLDYEIEVVRYQPLALTKEAARSSNREKIEVVRFDVIYERVVARAPNGAAEQPRVDH